MDPVALLRLLAEYNELVVGVLAALVISTVILLLLRSVRANDEEVAGTNLKSLEETLQKVLASQPHAGAIAYKQEDPVSIIDDEEMLNALGEVSPASVSAASSASGAGSSFGGVGVGSPGTATAGAAAAAASAMGANATQAGGFSAGRASAAPVSEAELERLKQLEAAVNEREARIKSLQAALELAQREAASTAASGPESGGADPLANLELQNKLRELEARLAEYEIIEDDIADLSLYKEENARLKKTIENIQGGQANVTQAVAAATVSEPAAPQPGVPQLRVVKNVEPAQVEELEPQTAPEEVTGIPVTQNDADDVMLEFQQAVVQQRAADPAIASQIDLSMDVSRGFGAGFGAGASTDAEEPHTPDAEEIAAQTLGMEADPSAESTLGDPLAVELDPMKMIAEVEELSGETAEDALAAGLDTDKLLAEVSDLGAAEGDAAEDDDLFGEFKDVAKGGR